MAKLAFQGWRVLIRNGRRWEKTNLLIRGYYKVGKKMFLSVDAANTVSTPEDPVEFKHLQQHEGFILKQLGLAKRLLPQYTRAGG